MKAEKRAQRKLEKNKETVPENDLSSEMQQPIEETGVTDDAV